MPTLPRELNDACNGNYMDFCAGFTGAAAICLRARRVAACLMANRALSNSYVLFEEKNDFCVLDGR